MLRECSCRPRIRPVARCGSNDTPIGSLPFGQRLELVAQHPPHHQDAAVALAEMFFGMQRHRPLADLRLVIPGKLLVLLLGHVPPEFAVEFRAHPADVAGLLDAAGDIDAE